MRIRNFVHKGLKRLYEDGNPKGLPAASADKLSKMLAFLDAMEDAEELRSVPIWKAHELAGSRRGTWSLHVTKNWRLTFTVDAAGGEIADVDFEDYH